MDSPVAQPLNSAAQTQHIEVLSLDFDGCLFHNNGYILDPRGPGFNQSPTRLVDSNNHFLKTISEEIKTQNFNRVILMVGSNRQSKSIDDVNAAQGAKGSCFPALIALSEEIKRRVDDPNIHISHDPFLLADAYHQLNSGTVFNNALTGTQPSSPQPWCFDETKITVLYAQMHKIAVENPNSQITFNFYDDRHDILNGLATFYGKNPTLVPSNVTLCLYHYEGKDITPQNKIRGTGVIDPTYSTSLKLIVGAAGYDPDNQAHYETDEKLHRDIAGIDVSEFITNRAANILPIQNQLPLELTDLIRTLPINTTAEQNYVAALYALRDDLGKDIQAMQPTEIHDSAAVKITTATYKMINALTQLSADATKDDVIDILKTYENECSQTPGYQKFLKGIATVIIAALVASLFFGGTMMALDSIAGGVIADVLHQVASGTMDLIQGSITTAATQVLISAGVGLFTGIASGVGAGYLFFKPASNVSAVIDNAKAAWAKDLSEGSNATTQTA